MYMDYNSLYPSTMSSSKLPFKGFEFVDENEYQKVIDDILTKRKYYDEMNEDEMKSEEMDIF